MRVSLGDCSDGEWTPVVLAPASKLQAFTAHGGTEVCEECEEQEPSYTPKLRSMKWKRPRSQSRESFRGSSTLLFELNSAA